MPDNNISNPKMNAGQVNEIKRVGFWISQLFILLATIIGVYLAANQGYKQAVQFENMTSYKENYYLQKSLQYELQDNIVILKDYIARVKDDGIGSHIEPLTFYRLVWENMKFSGTTLATPPELLREAQRFYRDITVMYEKINTHKVSSAYGLTKLQEYINHAETTLLPALEESTNQIKKVLDNSDVIL